MDAEERAIGSGLSDFGTLLRQHRIATGLSQEALAERAQMSTEGISALERGFRRTPHRGTLALLAGALALDREERREFEEAAARRLLLGRKEGASLAVGPWRLLEAPPLPLSQTTFIGRKAEIAEITGLIHSHRFVTITGAGGIGKTQTALRIASVLEDGNLCPIVFVPLAPIGNASHVMPAIAAELGVQEVPQRPLLETLLAYLSRKKTVLVIDNAEHVIDEAARVVETLLRGAPQLRVLATSRAAFKAAGERVYRLPSMALDDAVSLFADRARSVDAHFTLTEAKTSKVTELCRRLDGIPLAIELTAARVDSFSIDELGQHLEGHLGPRTGTARYAPTRQQTMRATIEWSYNLLSAGERRVFERLSIFAGGGTLDAAASVCVGDGVSEAQIADLISPLVTKSLLVADLDRDEPRYRLLEPFRDYARKRLTERGEDNLIAHRHALACLKRAERWMNLWETEPDSTGFSFARAEIENWRAALDWTLNKRGDVLLGRQIAGMLTGPWTITGALIEGRQWAQLGLEVTDENTPQRIVADLLSTYARLSHNLHECEEAIAVGNRALPHYRALGDQLSFARLQTVVGHAYCRLGRAGEGMALIEDALAAARQAKSIRATVYALRCLSNAKAFAGDEAAGRRDALEALQIAEQRGDYVQSLMILIDVAACCSDDVQLALQYVTRVTEATPFPCRLDDLANALNRASVYSFLLGHYDEALAKAQEALDLDDSHDVPAETSTAIRTIATLAALRPEMFARDPATNVARAARLLGYAVESIRDGERPFQRVRDARHDALAVLAGSIGMQRVERLMAEGSAMTREQAISEAFALCG
ncbi:MAG: helix-turn-helix domain-containing protein [Candidatus Cybelea sp.]